MANRVSEIQRTLPGAQWHHVASQDNPADCASRGLQPLQLPDFALWWTGPRWLSSTTGWTTATQPTIPLTDLEAKTTVNATSGEPAACEALLNRYSSIHSLLRITAWCLRWLPHSPDKRRGSSLLPDEIEAARTRWLSLVQQQHFRGEIQHLHLSRPLPSRSRLLRLNPYLDEQGLIRVGGRLRHSPLAMDAKHPVVLPWLPYANSTGFCRADNA